MRRIGIVIFGVALLINYPAYADSCLETGATPNTWYDQSHDYLSQKFCEPAAWFDNFFSNDRSDDERRAGSFVRWRNEFVFSEDRQTPKLRTQLSANITLPRLTRRLHLLLMREDEDETSSTLTDNTQPNPTNPNDSLSFQRQQLNLALRYDLHSEPLSHFSISGGVRGGTPLKTFARGRYRYTHPLSDKLWARFTETLYWKNLDGFGETSRIDLERQISDDTLLRWSNSATFSELSQGLDLNSELALLHQLSEKSALSVMLGAWAHTLPVAFDTAALSLRYRRNFYRRWLFYEFEPVVSWQANEEGRREFVPAATLRLEVQFERIK